MTRIWKNVDLYKEVPELGLKLPLALQAPQFVTDFLQSSYLRPANSFYCFPLDEVKQWLRGEGGQGGERREELADILLGEEREVRQAASNEGVPFDLVDYELLKMEGGDYESFELPVLQRLLEGVLDDCDELRVLVEKETAYPFNLSVGFSLPLPQRNKELSQDVIKKALQEFGASSATLKKLEQQKVKAEELEGMINFDFSQRGRAGFAERSQDTGVVRVTLVDPRAGDSTDLQIWLSYPLEYEGYFLASFEGIAKDLSLKSHPPLAS